MDIGSVDYSAGRFWMDVLQLAGIVGLFIYTKLTGRSKQNTQAINTVRQDVETRIAKVEDDLKSDIDTLKGRVARAEKRQGVFETRLEGAPTHQDLSKVYDKLNDVSADLSGVSGQMRALAHQLSMVNQYLLNNKGGQGS